MYLRVSCLIATAAACWGAGPQAAAGENDSRIVIAHRGASGYLPEHTLEAVTYAHATGADYIEQDVVLSKDNQPMVLHDTHLDTVTDVAKRFPEKRRSDGRYYAIDLTLAEIKQLQVTERIDHQTGQAVYPSRFPPRSASFRVPTLPEEIELIQGLNKSTGRSVGIYTEIKSPAWHRQQGRDISRIVLEVLTRYGYRHRDDAVYLQCFDVAETRRVRNELKCDLKLIQLIGDRDSSTTSEAETSGAWHERLKRVAQYADGIGPSMALVVSSEGDGDRLTKSPLVTAAHHLGLQVHPYTLRADSLPAYADSFERLLTIFYVQLGVDGVFTDFPDRAVEYLRHVEAKAGGGAN